MFFKSDKIFKRKKSKNRFFLNFQKVVFLGPKLTKIKIFITVGLFK